MTKNSRDLISELKKARQDLTNAQARVTELETASHSVHNTTPQSSSVTAFLTRFDVRVSVGYGIVATLWILFSDQLLAILMLQNLKLSADFSLFKGLIFVWVTALILFSLLYAELRKRKHIEQALEHDLINRKQAEENVKKLNRTLSVLSDINQAIVRIRHMPTLFDEVCKIAVEKGAFRMAWVGLLDAQTRQVKPVAQAGFTEDYLDKLNISLDDEVRGRGPTGNALRSNQSVIVNDMQTEPQMQPWRESALRLGYSSTAALPLIVSGEARGILAFYADNTGFFDEEEIKLVVEMAGDISFAMEFAEQEARRQQSERELQRYAKRMEILHEIDKCIINSMSIQSVVEIALKQVRQIIPCQRVSLMLLDDKTNEWLIFVADSDADTPLGSGTRIPNLSTSSEQFRVGRIAVTNDLRLLPDPSPAIEQLIKDGLLSSLHAHFAVENQTLGSLNLFADSTNYFTADHQEIAAEIADQLAIAIKQMRLSDEIAHHAAELEQHNIHLTQAKTKLERYAKRMEVLHEIDKGLIQGNSIQLLVQATLNHVRQLIPCQQANVTIVDHETHEGLIFALNLNGDTFFTQGVRSPLPADVFEGYDEKHIRIFEDIRLLQDTSPRAKQLVSEGMRSLLSALLMDQNTPIGSLVLVADTSEFFTAEYQEIATQIAAQLAIAIRQMRMSDEVHQSETQYRLLAENMVDVIWVLDVTTSHFTYISPSIEQLRGYTPEEALNQTLAETITPASLKMITDTLPARIEAFVAGDSEAVSQTYKIEQPCKDGSTVWTEVVTTLLQDSNGAIHLLGVARDITTRRQAEAELREREEWIRLSMKASGLGKWRYDIEKGILYFDEQSSKHYGFEHNTVPVDEVMAHIHPDDLERFKQELSATLDPARNYKAAMEYRILLPDGTQRWLSALSHIYFEGQGSARHAVYGFGTSQDITERKLSEQVLRETEERYRRVVEDQTDLICRYNADFKLTFVNYAYAALYNKHPDELIGLNFFSLMPETDRAVSQAYLTTLTPSNPVAMTEHRSLAADGSIHWIQWTDRALIDQSGVITEYQGVGRDITERKQAEDALRKAEAQERAMLSAIPDIIFRYDADGKFLDYHAPDTDLLAVPPERFLGKKAHDVLPSDLADSLLQRIQQVISTKQATQFEYVLPVTTGTREFESRLVPVGEDEVLAIVRDVTERKLAEKELQSLYNATSYLFKADNVLSLGQQIVAAVVREFEHADCGIVLLDKSKSKIIRLARIGQSDLHPETQLTMDGSGLIPEALRTGEVIYAPDVSQNSHYVPSVASTVSEFVIPLKTSNGIIGALDLQHAEKDAFSERDRRILMAYAERAAPAIEIMQLYDELNHYAVELESRVAQRTGELNHAKERAEAILNHSIDGIVLMDSQLLIQQTNSAFNALFSVEPDAYFEKPFGELLSKQDAQAVEQIMLNREAKRLEITAHRKDGTIFDAEFGFGFIKNNGIVCIISDITERKAQERQLRYYASLQESVVDAVIVTDNELHIQSWNRGAERIYGWKAEEVIGKVAPDLLHIRPSSTQNIDSLGQALIEKGFIQQETIQERKDGTDVFILGSATLLTDENGVPVGIISVNRDISERRRVEQQLRFDAAIQENMTEAVIVTDMEFRIQSWNKAAETIYGWTAAEVVGNAVSILQTRFESDDEQNQTRESLLAEGQWRDEFIQQRKDGSEINVQSSVSVFKDEKGISIGVIAVNRNITERKRAEQALRESEMRFGLLVNGVHDYAIYLLDPNGNIVTWNQGAARIKGYTAQEVIGKNFSLFFTPEDLASGEPEHILKIAATEGHFTAEGERVRKDSNRFWAEVEVTALKDSQGHLFAYAKVTRDLTERRKAQETLRHSEARYRLLAENITDIISRVTPDGIYIDISPSSTSVLGYTPEEMIGKPSVNFIHPNDKAALIQKRQMTLEQRSEIPLTYRFRHRDGHYIWLEVAQKLILSEANTVIEYVTSARDITIRKRAEEVLKNTLEKEKELNELKTRFVSTASHEFRTPLATILAIAETLLAYRRRLKDEEIDDKLSKITDQVSYLKTITEDMLQVVRLQDSKTKYAPTNLNLDALCRSVIDEFESRNDVTQKFVYSCDNTLQQVSLDPKLMRQIISNLVSNAVKYSLPNKTISISLQRVEASLIIEIQDEGIGIPEADLRHLFEPFHRATNVGTIPGTGLGLVITKESVELQGGFITVDSQLGKGTTFTIMLPLVDTKGGHHEENSAN